MLSSYLSVSFCCFWVSSLLSCGWRFHWGTDPKICASNTSGLTERKSQKKKHTSRQGHVYALSLSLTQALHSYHCCCSEGGGVVFSQLLFPLTNWGSLFAWWSTVCEYGTPNKNSLRSEQTTSHRPTDEPTAHFINSAGVCCLKCDPPLMSPCCVFKVFCTYYLHM